MLHCKICPKTRTFTTISSLRRHQWSDHRELYAKKTKEVALVREVKALKPELTVRELVEKLDAQVLFLTEHANFLRGWIKPR